MKVPADIQKRVLDTLRTGILKAEEAYGMTFKMPTVVYTKGGTTAGTANYRTWTINLNPGLLIENVETFLKRTVLHELGHLICDKVYPEANHTTFVIVRGRRRRSKRDVHGPRWQSIMITLGGPTDRCHNYDVTNVARKRTSYTYQCSACQKTYDVGSKINAQLQKDVGARRCKCGARRTLFLQLTSTPKPAPVVATPVVKQEFKAPTRGSKLEQCYEWYKHYDGKDKELIISVFINECKCTPAGASTYWYTCRKMDAAEMA